MKAGWKETRVGEVCTVIAGQSPEGSAYNDKAVGLPFYQGKKEFGERLLGAPTTWTTITTKEAMAGDILMSVRAPVGPINEASERICIGRGLAAIRAKTRLNRDFLWYALLWLQPSIKGTSGAVFDSINKAGIEGLPIPLPPLEEQQQIVAVLDEAFEGLARARAHAEANLRDARELFERGLSMLLAGERGDTAYDGNDDWPEMELGELVTFHNGDRGKNYPNKHEYVTNGIPWLNTGHIMPNGSLSPSKMNFISEEKFQTLGGGRIQPGDLVFCLRGATIGKTAFVAPYETGTVASSLMIIRPGERISDRYTYYFLTSDLGKAEIGKFIGGAAQPNLAGGSVGKFNIRLPPIDVQDQLVEKLDRMRNDREILQRRYIEKIQDLDALRQSILQKAFAGELT